MLTTPALVFAIVAAAGCVLVLAAVVAATWPSPHVPAHQPRGRHDWLTMHLPPSWPATPARDDDLTDEQVLAVLDQVGGSHA